MNGRHVYRHVARHVYLYYYDWDGRGTNWMMGPEVGGQSRGVQSINLKGRALAELYRAHHEALRRTLVCEAWVHGSPLARGVLRAIHWLYRTPWPSAVYRTLPEAENRCVRALARHGLRPGGDDASARPA